MPLIEWLMDRIDPTLRLECWWRYSVLKRPRPTWWRHGPEWECGVPFPHIHYGENIVERVTEHD